ncbi:MAG TPA: single-stranded DNA-binding protein [Brumimicrobium sp.]|nr:single-stranded DNA-binding protein [Brumimicrobium sp.]
MRVQQMNFVNLIGQITNEPQIILTEDGRKIAKFALSTKEMYLDEKGNTKEIKNWHRVTAWGKWVPILEQLCQKGQSIAIEGRLRSKFFSMNGYKNAITEIEINDLVIL